MLFRFLNLETDRFSLSFLVRVVLLILLSLVVILSFLLILTPSAPPPVYLPSSAVEKTSRSASSSSFAPRQILPIRSPTVALNPTFAQYLPSSSLLTTHRRSVNVGAPYCCANWSVWVNSVELTSNGLLRMDVSIHNDTLFPGVAFVANPTLIDDQGRTYDVKKELTEHLNVERPVAAGSSVEGSLFFPAPAAGARWVDFVYASGYSWLRGIDLP